MPFCPLTFFENLLFQEDLSRIQLGLIGLSYSMNPDLAQNFVKPDLGLSY